MILALTSFIAGALSVLAPCVVAFIPVIFSRTVHGRRPWLILLSLGFSIFIFSILLKSTTLFIDIPFYVWSILSGLIVFVFGILTLFPVIWEKISLQFGFSLKAQQGFATASTKKGVWGDLLLGASLGPIFSACSPTYALIVATILPADLLSGLVYLLAYIAGLMTILAGIVVFGKKAVVALGWGINPNSRFHKVLGIVLIVLGIIIMTGFDKSILSFLIESGWFDWQINLESNFIK